MQKLQGYYVVINFLTSVNWLHGFYLGYQRAGEVRQTSFKVVKKFQFVWVRTAYLSNAKHTPKW